MSCFLQVFFNSVFLFDTGVSPTYETKISVTINRKTSRNDLSRSSLISHDTIDN